jgi:flagellar biosynthetic protein FliS
MSTATAALAAYARSSASTADPAEVVRMAYERIVAACDRAADAAGDRNAGWVQRFHDETTRAQALLVELSGMLATRSADPAVATMARDLGDLYAFAIRLLTDANVGKDAAPLAAVRTTIDGLRQAWAAGVLAS